MTKDSEDTLARIEAALTAADWEKLDFNVRRARRKKYISQSMEHILLAEGELQKALSRINIDLASTKEELEVFEPLQDTSAAGVKLDGAREELKKADLSASDYERRVSTCV